MGACAIGRRRRVRASCEGKQKATALGIAGGLGVVAAVLALYAVGFLFASAAAALDEALSLWLALLVVAVVIPRTHPEPPPAQAPDPE